MKTVQVVARWVCAGCGRHATTTVRPDGHWRIDGDALVWCARFRPTPERPIPILQEG